jgi:hypothetical protein
MQNGTKYLIAVSLLLIVGIALAQTSSPAKSAAVSTSSKSAKAKHTNARVAASAPRTQPAAPPAIQGQANSNLPAGGGLAAPPDTHVPAVLLIRVSPRRRQRAGNKRHYAPAPPDDRQRHVPLSHNQNNDSRRPC